MKRECTDLEFADWTLLPSEAVLLANKTGPTRLGFAVLLKFFQYAARFPHSMQEVPTTVVAYIARQVGVPAEEFSRYDWEGRAVKYHRAQIRTFLGFREPTVQDAEELAVWLSEHVLPQGHPDEHVNAAAYKRLRNLGIEPPTPERLERILASASSAFEGRFCTETVDRLPPATLGRLEALLSATTEDGETAESEHSPLQQLKMDPGRVGLDNALEEISKLRQLRELNLPQNLFPPATVAAVSATRCRGECLRDPPPPRVIALQPDRCLLLAAGTGDHRRLDRAADPDHPPHRRDGRAARRTRTDWHLETGGR
jgi:hypothetical protein